MLYKTYYLLLWTVVLTTISSCNKDPLAKLGTTQQFDIISANTGTEYTVTVFYPDKAMPTTPVPVVYVTDGFWYRDMTARIISDLSSAGEIPKVLMVSIDYKKGEGVYARSADLVYPIEDPGFDKANGDKFFSFLTSELAPRIETTYPADTTQRTFLGHSLGGFFALYSLLDNAANPFFKKVVAASCSIGLGKDNAVFVKEAQVAQAVSDIPATLFIGCGELVGSAPAMHQQFYNRIQSRNYPNLKVAYETYPKSHATDPFPSFKNGLKYVFNN
jgi:hypothetical protein